MRRWEKTAWLATFDCSQSRSQQTDLKSTTVELPSPIYNELHSLLGQFCAVLCSSFFLLHTLSTSLLWNNIYLHQKSSRLLLFSLFFLSLTRYYFQLSIVKYFKGVYYSSIISMNFSIMFRWEDSNITNKKKVRELFKICICVSLFCGILMKSIHHLLRLRVEVYFQGTAAYSTLKL